MIKKILALVLCFGLFACENAESITINDGYMFATPKTFPAAAIFMTIENNTTQNDRMIDFKTDRAGRTELHTMETKNDIMKMRRVDGYDILSNGSHTLKPMADHIMVFDMPSDFVEGETISATAIFEKAGEIPVTIAVKSRESMKNHMH